MKTSIKTVLSSALLIGTLSSTATAAEIKKSTVVLVHSAFTGPWAMESVATELRKSGYNVILPELPAHGSDKTLPKDVQFSDYVTKVVSELDKQDDKVILLGHSFAGTIISEAAEQRPEKIQSLVYLAAGLLPNGASFFDTIKDSGSVLVKNLEINEEKGYVTVGNDKTHEAYSQDVPLEQFKAAEKFVVPEPLAPLLHKVELSEEKFGKLPKYYIQALRDNAIPQSLQRKMYTETKVKQVFTITSGHAPNLSQPGKVADILKTINSIENKKLSHKVEQKVKKEIIAMTDKWQKGFNLDAKAKKAKNTFRDYSANAILQSMPEAFGTVQGKENIAKYWQVVLNTGAADMKYLDRNIIVVDEKTALLSSPWSMNKIKGIITLEKWVKKGNKWVLIEDNFEALEFLK